MPNIRVDSEVYSYLKGLAEPFTDTPNSVLRRVLQLDPSMSSHSEKPRFRDGARTSSTSKRPKKKATRRKHPRLPGGVLLPLDEYFEPIIAVLADRGGKALARDVIREVGHQIEPRLTPADLEILDSGLVRWQSRVQFARHRLVESGRLAGDSPRGLWVLAERAES